MYYTVVDVRHSGVIYTGMSSEKKYGLLREAMIAFPQYGNLRVIEMPGEMPKTKSSKVDDIPY